MILLQGRGRHSCYTCKFMEFISSWGLLRKLTWSPNAETNRETQTADYKLMDICFFSTSHIWQQRVGSWLLNWLLKVVQTLLDSSSTKRHHFQTYLVSSRDSISQDQQDNDLPLTLPLKGVEDVYTGSEAAPKTSVLCNPAIWLSSPWEQTWQCNQDIDTRRRITFPSSLIPKWSSLTHPSSLIPK